MKYPEKANFRQIIGSLGLRTGTGLNINRLEGIFGNSEMS